MTIFKKKNFFFMVAESLNYTHVVEIKKNIYTIN